MKHKQKLRSILASVLIVVLLSSSIPAYANITSFKDVPKSRWSHKYIIKMAESGYIQGMGDGSFNPAGNITFMQSMALLSRFTKPSDVEKRVALSKWGSFLKTLNISQSWEKEAIAIALENKIISENEVNNASKQKILHKPIQKVAASVFLAKSMGLKERAEKLKAGDLLLNYKDIESINPELRKYIKVLEDTGVIEGDETGRFNPKEALRREIMAKMLYEADDYLKKNPTNNDDKTPERPIEPEEKDKIDTVRGTIEDITEEIGKDFIVLEISNGREKSFIIDSNTEITVDGRRGSISSLKNGQEAELKINERTRALISIDSKTVEKDIEGAVTYLSTLNDQIEIERNEDGRIRTREYDLDSNVKLELNGRSEKIERLRNGDYVKLRFKNNKVVEIIAKSEEINIRGDIVKIDRDSKVGQNYVMTLETDEDEKFKILLDSTTKIERDRTSARAGELREGDDVYAIARYDVDKNMYLGYDVDARIVTKKVKGYVLAITTRVNKNPTVTIKNFDNGKEETYELTSNAYIKVDDRTTSTLPQDPGYEVELYVSSGKEIVEAYADSAGMQNSLIGKIEEINRREDFIEIDIKNISGNSDISTSRYMKIYIEDDTVITDRKLEKLDIYDLSRGDTVTVIGQFKGASFIADTIHVTDYR